jgi:hypothetical protein
MEFHERKIQGKYTESCSSVQARVDEFILRSAGSPPGKSKDDGCRCNAQDLESQAIPSIEQSRLFATHTFFW